MASPAPASVSGTSNHRLHRGGHAYHQNSPAEAGGVILDSRMTGFPNLTIASPRNNPNARANQSNAVNRTGIRGASVARTRPESFSRFMGEVSHSSDRGSVTRSNSENQNVTE